MRSEPRQVCYSCRRAKSTCYCDELRPFYGPFDLIILMHPRESKNPVGTARMLHRAYINSKIWIGAHFDETSLLAEELKDPNKQYFLLYPGGDARDLSKGPVANCDSRLKVVVVIDGTWDQAKSIVRKSPLLRTLQKVSFTADIRSQYKIRKQPRPECLSTLEATEQLMHSFEEAGWATRSFHNERAHLISLFSGMVQKQLRFAGDENGEPKKRRTVGERKSNKHE